MLTDLSIPERIKKIYNTCNNYEKDVLKRVLWEIAEYGESKTYEDIWLADYKEIPVDLDTFIEDDLYLGQTNNNGKAVYPFWRKTMREIFDAGNKYEEVVFTGATRIGKSSTAITCAAYMLYKLMCLKDPQAYYGKKEISKFSVLFFNITKDLARGVAYREFQDTLRASTWFNQHGTFSKSERNFYYIPEGDKVIIDYGSDAAHALGQQVLIGVMDECNFSRAGVKDVTKAKEHMQDLYNTVSARIKGTFRVEGEVHGKLFAVSSKRSDSDFLELYVQNQIEAGAGEHMYIADAPQWEVLPKSMFSTQTFYIAVGDQHKKGFVVPETTSDNPEALKELSNQGYTLLTPPIDMKSDFTADFDIALRDLAGISVPGSLSFITQDVLTQCIVDTEIKNPFYNDILQIGTRDNYSIEEFFHINEIPASLRLMPMFIHLDLSLNTDKTGISGVCISGAEDIDVDGRVISQPTFSHIFSISLEAPRGDKIPYNKITSFICWLRDKGFNIAGISRDQFQSEYMAQLLEGQGFTVDKLSLDRTPDGYLALRSVLLEKRIKMLDVKFLQDELIHLQRDSISGKIDHQIGRCLTGDTKIRLIDGRSLTVVELLEEQKYKTNWVYTVNETTGKIEPKKIKDVFQTMLTSCLVRVTLDNGESVTCTPNHKFMLRDGSYKEAQYLDEGESLMPLYTKIAEKGLQGYRMYYDPVPDTWHFEHRQFCDNATLKNGYVIHHCNYDKLNNCPSNLKCMTRSEHQTIHNNTTLDYTKSSKSIANWHKNNRGTDKYKIRFKKMVETRRKNLERDENYQKKKQAKAARIRAIEEYYGIVWDELPKHLRAAYGRRYNVDTIPGYIDAVRSKVNPESENLRRKHVSESTKNMMWITNGTISKYVPNTTKIPEGFYRGRVLTEVAKQHMAESVKNRSPEMKEVLRKLRSTDTSNRIWVTNGVVDKYIQKDEMIPEGFTRGRCKIQKRNHKVVSVKFIHEPCRVYDLTIEDNPNFALDAGVFVHNSKDMSDSFAGAIWNAILKNPGVPVPVKSVASVISGINSGRYSGSSSSSWNPFGNIRKF